MLGLADDFPDLGHLVRGLIEGLNLFTGEKSLLSSRFLLHAYQHLFLSILRVTNIPWVNFNALSSQFMLEPNYHILHQTVCDWGWRIFRDLLSEMDACWCLRLALVQDTSLLMDHRLSILVVCLEVVHYYCVVWEAFFGWYQWQHFL